jgi:hypothetical protein
VSLARPNAIDWPARAAEAKTYKDRAKVLRDFLDQLPPQNFDLRHWGAVVDEDGYDTGMRVVPKPECGTVGCIAGWAAYLLDIRQYAGGQFSERARKWLGLSQTDADRMFVPRAYDPVDAPFFMSKATTRDAVAMLDRFLATGEVKWRHLDA